MESFPESEELWFCTTDRNSLVFPLFIGRFRIYGKVVFLMDRLLRPFGLNGKSIVPLVSGTACTIPAVISTRNIENVKERLLTILVTPFMTCSARLPVYSIIIGLIISEGTFLGIKYKALVLMGMYLLGF